MKNRRSDKIADALEELVFAGEFKDGDRLDEIKLAEKFGVSRTPIRESLQRLVAASLAEQIPNRGVFVRQPGPVELMQMFEAMAEIEAVCARLAAQRITENHIETLKSANQRCLAAIEAQDADSYYRCNELFHHTIYKSCGNIFVEAEAFRLHRRLKPFRRIQLRLRGRMAQSMREHEAVVLALENGEAEQAAGILRGHVAVQGEKFYRLMASLKPQVG